MISIIIPTLNEEKWIGKTVVALKSRLTIQNEIIVSDCNSSDKTVEIAKKCADKVITYSEEKRIYGGGARNRGAAEAKGEFFAFIDSGCFITDPDSFFNQALENFKDEKIVAISGKIEVMPEIATWVDKMMSGIINGGHWFLNNVIDRGSAWGKFMMVRKTAFEKIGGFNPELAAGEDMDFFGKLATIGKTRIDPRLRVFHPNRRANQIGWIHLLWTWFVDTLYRMFFKKTKSKEWKPIR